MAMNTTIAINILDKAIDALIDVRDYLKKTAIAESKPTTTEPKRSFQNITIAYAPDLNTVYIGANKGDVHEEYLKHLLETHHIPTTAKIVYSPY